MKRSSPHLIACASLLLATHARAQGGEDPWRMADDEFGRAGKAAALAFAKGRVAPDIEQLRAYLESDPPVQSGLRAALAKARDLDKAKKFREVVQVLAPLEMTEGTLLEARIWDLRAKAHAILGANDEARRALLRWDEIAESLGWLCGREQAFHWEMILLGELPSEELADLHERRADVAKQLGQTRKMHEALIDRAGQLILLGRVREGLEILPASLGAAEEAGWKSAEAAARDHRAMALRIQGDYAAALDEVERAERLWNGLGRPDGIINNANLKAAIQLDIGDFEAAEAGFERVRRLIPDGGDGSFRAADRVAVKGNLGEVAWRRGQHERALSFFAECRKDFKALGDRGSHAMACKDMGEVLIDSGQPDEALPHLDEALKGFGTDPLARAATLVAQADAHVRAGRPKRAAPLLEAALHVEDGDRDRPTRNRLYEVQARVLLALDQPGEAVTALRKALDLVDDVVLGLSDEQTFSAREQRARLFQVAIESAFRCGQEGAIVEFLERSRAAVLRDAIDNRRTLWRARWKEDIPKDLHEAEQDVVEARLQWLQALKGDTRKPVDEARAALDVAEERLRELSNRVESKHKRRRNVVPTRPAALEEIQALLRDGEAIVYYALPEAAGYALCVTKKEARPVELGDASPIRALCARARDACMAEDGDLPEAELREALVDRLSLPKDVQTVMVCPDGPLSYLPWPVLLDARYGSTLPSGSIFVQLRRRPAAKGRGVLAFGDPDYLTAPVVERIDVSRGVRLVPLPRSREEVEAITASGEGNNRFLGKKATEASARAGLRRDGRWRSVHFACHGVVDHRFPRRSALALTPEGSDDGFLTIPEIMALDVSADLVVLSACDSGGGAFIRGEGVVGLTRAFLAAGAPCVVASLWKVNDSATKDLMIRFYEELAGEGGDAGRLRESHVSRALRAAQRRVSKEAGWEHPRFWAAWVVWGLPD